MTRRECRNLVKRRLLGIPLMLGLVPALLISPLNARAVVIHSHGGNSGHAHLTDAEDLERWHHEHPDPCTDPIGDDENAKQTATDAFIAVFDNEDFELVLPLPSSVLARLSNSAGQDVNLDSPQPISPCLARHFVDAQMETTPLSWPLRPHACLDASVLTALLLTSNALLL